MKAPLLALIAGLASLSPAFASVDVQAFLPPNAAAPDAPHERLLKRALDSLEIDHPTDYAELIHAASPDGDPQGKFRAQVLKRLKAKKEKQDFDHPEKFAEQLAQMARKAEREAGNDPRVDQFMEPSLHDVADRDVRAFVQKQMDYVSPGDPQRTDLGIVGKVLEEIKRSQPAAYRAIAARLAHAGKPGFDQLLAASSGKETKAAAEVILQRASAPASDGNIFGGALASASAPGVAAPSGASVPEVNNGRPVDGNSKGKIDGHADPVDAVQKLIVEDAQKREDVAAVFNNFIWGPILTDGQSFVAVDVRKENDATGGHWRQETLHLARAWVDQSVGDPKNGVAQLFYILYEPGPELSLPWVSENNIPNPGLKSALEKYLFSKWGNNPYSGASAGGGVDTWVSGFLAAGATEAEFLIEKHPVPDKIKEEINRLDNRSGHEAPGGANLGRNGGTGGKMSAEGFGSKQLLGQFGDEDVFSVIMPDGHSRYVSVRLVTYRDAQYHLKNEIGLYDITCVSNSKCGHADAGAYGRVIDIPDGENSQPVVLKPANLDGTPGFAYTVSFKNTSDGQLKFSLSAGKNPALTRDNRDGITISRLYDLRREHALSLVDGHPMTMDVPPGSGKSYYVMPQATGMGCLQLLDKNSVDNGPSDKIKVAYFGCTNHLEGDQAVDLKNKNGDDGDDATYLGPDVDQDTLPNGKLEQYWLKYKSIDGMNGTKAWQVDGPREDAPKPPPPPDSGDKPGDKPGSKDGDSTGGQSGSSSAPKDKNSDGWPATADYFKSSVNLPTGVSPEGPKKAGELNDDLDPSISNSARIYSYPKDDKGNDGRWWFISKSGLDNSGSLALGDVKSYLGVHIENKKLFIADDVTGNIYDLDKALNNGGSKINTDAGTIFNAGQIKNITDPEIMRQVLIDRASPMPKAAIDDFLAKSADVVNNGIKAGQFSDNGDPDPNPKEDIAKGPIKFMGALDKNDGTPLALGIISSQGIECVLYPQSKRRCGPSATASAAQETLKGPGIQMNAEFKFVDDRLPASISEDKSDIPAAARSPDDGAALYRVVVPSGKPNDSFPRWWLRFLVKVGDSPAKMTGDYQLFDDTASSPIRPPKDFPNGIDWGGLTLKKDDLPDPDNAKVELLHGSSTDQGAVVLRSAPQGKDANCVGVVLAWGMSRADAFNKCQQKQ